MSKVQVERDWLEYYENSLTTQTARLAFNQEEITRREALRDSLLKGIERDKAKIIKCKKKITQLSIDKQKHTMTRTGEVQ